MAEHPAGDGASTAIVTAPSTFTSRRQRIVDAIINSFSSSTNVSGLPLPSTANITVMGDMYPIVERLFMKSLLHMHSLQQTLHDWMPLVDGIVCPGVFFSQTEPTHFDLERFESVHLYLGQLGERPTPDTVHAVRVLTMVRFALARFISAVYIEIDQYGSDTLLSSRASSFLGGLDQTFSNLKNAVSEIRDLAQINILTFDKLEDNARGSTCFNTRAIGWISSNEERLDDFLRRVLARYRRTRTIRYLPLVVGAISASLIGVWAIKSLSFNLKQIGEAINAIMRNVVLQPLSNLRVELLKTSDEAEQMMELGDVKATSNLLHKLLLNFSVRTTGHESSDEQMLRTVTNRFEKQVQRPITNLFKGELIEAIIIQVQKLKLDLERAGDYVFQKIKANELLCAIAPTIPAILLSCGLLGILSACIRHKMAEMQQKQRKILRWLNAEVRNVIRQCIENLENQPNEENDETEENDENLDRTVYLHGLAMYTLDRLYRAVEMNAKATGEWPRLKRDIIELQRLAYQVDKFERMPSIVERLEKEYTCLQ